MAEFRYHDIHRLSTDEVLKRMETASGGLSPEEARLLFEQSVEGDNILSLLGSSR